MTVNSRGINEEMFNITKNNVNKMRRDFIKAALAAAISIPLASCSSVQTKEPPSRVILAAINADSSSIFEYVNCESGEELREICSVKTENGAGHPFVISKGLNYAYVSLSNIDVDSNAPSKILKLEWKGNKVSYKKLGNFPKFRTLGQNSKLIFVEDCSNRIFTIDKTKDKAVYPEKKMKYMIGNKNVLLLRRENDGKFCILDIREGTIIHEFESPGWPDDLYNPGTRITKAYGYRKPGETYRGIRMSPSGRYIVFINSSKERKAQSELFVKIDSVINVYDTETGKTHKVSYTTLAKKHYRSPVSISDEQLKYWVNNQDSVVTKRLNLKTGKSSESVQKYKELEILHHSASVQTIAKGGFPETANEKLQKAAGIKNDFDYLIDSFDEKRGRYYVCAPGFFYNIDRKTKEFSRIKYPESIRRAVIKRKTEIFVLTDNKTN